jgi:hypothetical protein
MHKLVILIEPLKNADEFHSLWPEFLSHAEHMPALLREASSQVESTLFGERVYAQMHELYFATQSELQQALDSEPGQKAGRILHQITRDRLSLFTAECKEESGDSLRQFQAARS